MPKMNVAVYGTLRNGYGNHRFITQADGELVGEGKTRENFSMFASGIPFVSSRIKENPVKVEVYSIDEDRMSDIDALEGHPDWYERRETTVVLEDGTEVNAWLYFNDAEESNFEGMTKVEDGDYASYRKGRY